MPAAPTPGSPGVGVFNRAIVTWDAAGNPLVRTVQVFSKAQVSEIAMAAASMPYVGPETVDDAARAALGLSVSEFYGMTNLEVMLIKQARKAATTGESAEVDAVLDRLIGKPLAKTESKTLALTYEDFLKQKAAEESQGQPPPAAASPGPRPAVIDAEVVPGL